MKKSLIACSVIFSISFVPYMAKASGAAPLVLNNELNLEQQVQTNNRDIILKGAKLISKFGVVEKIYSISVPNELPSKEIIIAWLVSNGTNKKVIFSNVGTGYLWIGDTWSSLNGQNITASITVDFMEKNGLPFSQNDEGETGINLNAVMGSPNKNNTTSASYILKGSWTKAVPDIMKTLDSLASFKEGPGSIGDTVYIFIDPKCPWCHKAYKNTRNIVAKGFTIKWIPTNLRGGQRLSSAILDSENSKVFSLIMSTPISELDNLESKMPNTTTPIEALYKKIDDNGQFLMNIFREHPEIELQGVPAALMLDHTTGRPRLVMGISEQEVLENVFGK
ncbi:hypothetical protein SJI19_16555 [Acerihabitans sp. TG2]|uniref:hypothetical protein n=1 Tax=Acerihabitans sp. TG2 TaxID=3096008 RepID=UPI002B232200|nr:hypothetical protein [Acerihabitans sp. TG2]MEA9392136.1 hypothetical protein [Acerihabitans sp. TG2]